MSITCDRLRKQRLSGPVNGIRCPRVVHYGRRLPLIEQLISPVPGCRPPDLLPQAERWAQFEAADTFNDVLARAVLAHGRSAGG
jgi:hypothetical protein